jgi:ABC-type uncharacterized transport system permease subunit
MTALDSAPVEVHEPRVRDREALHRRVRLAVTFAIALVLLVWMTLSISNPHVTYILTEQVTRDHQPHSLNGTWVSWTAIAVTAAALVLAAFDRFPRGLAGGALGFLVGLAFYLGFLMWAYADQGSGFVAAIANPILGTIDIATPIVFGALAGVIGERSGVINIAIEAQFLTGAFFASVLATLALNAFMGLVGGILAGLLIAALLGLFALRYQVNQVVVGVVLVAFATGLTNFLLGQIPDTDVARSYLNNPPVLDPLRIPGLADIPLLGEALFDQTVLVYLMYVSVVLVTVLLYQTKWGLRVRAVGEHPQAADTVGIEVNRVRWQAVLVGGVFAGLGGAYYTVGSTGAFDREVSAGTGFIALAAVIMGRWHPVGASFAALFFGFMWNLQNQLSFAAKIPGELLGAAPYLATVIAVAGFVGRVRPPAADGEPYVKS